MAEKPPTTNLEDNNVVAFLVLKGHKIKPWRDTKDHLHITFDIEGDSKQIEDDMQKYYDNEKVGIQDFVNCLKNVKSQQYSMKKVIKA